jgi:hypothetical protein
MHIDDVKQHLYRMIMQMYIYYYSSHPLLSFGVSNFKQLQAFLERGEESPVKSAATASSNFLIYLYR